MSAATENIVEDRIHFRLHDQLPVNQFGLKPHDQLHLGQQEHGAFGGPADFIDRRGRLAHGCQQASGLLDFLQIGLSTEVAEITEADIVDGDLGGMVGMPIQDQIAELLDRGQCLFLSR